MRTHSRASRGVREPDISTSVKAYPSKGHTFRRPLNLGKIIFWSCRVARRCQLLFQFHDAGLEGLLDLVVLGGERW
jgi:hypothetical protein